MEISTKNLFLISEKKEESVFHKETGYVVPLYQREYSWGEEEIKKFIHNLFEVKTLYPNKPYFMGTLQFNINEEGKREIVDGQQRMLTLLLFIKYLQFKDPKLCCENYFDTIEILNSQIAKDLLCSATFENPKNKFDLAFSYIDIYIKMQDYNSKDILEYIKNIYFVVIETEEMPLSEIVSIFNIINTTGMDLGTKDIFKVQYFSYLRKIGIEEGANDSSLMNKINSIYQKVETFNCDVEERNKNRKIAEDVTKYPFQTISVEMLLDALKTAIISHKSFPSEGIVEKLKMGTQSFFENFFREKQSIDIYYDVLSIEKVQKLLDIIKALYEKIYFSDKRLLCCEPLELLSLQLIDETRYGWRGAIYTFPYIYLLKKPSLTDDDYAEALRYSLALAKYLTKKSLLKDRVVNEVFTQYTDAIENGMEKIQDSIIFGKKEDYNSWENEELAKIVNGRIADDRTKKRIICVLSGIIDEINNQTMFDDILGKFYNRANRKRKRRNPFEIEHIKAKHNIQEDEELYNSIGNLVVLESSINESIQDKEEKKKIEKYAKSRFSSVKKIIATMEKEGESFWTKELAEGRKEKEVKVILDFLS